MTEIKHTEAFDLAFRFVTETNLNIFLTGKAGTGKTTFLKYLRQNSFKKMVVAAPTGVAAINAGGVTLHSLFQLPFAPYVPSKDSRDGINSHSLLSQIRYNKEKLNLFRNLELLVIDETSMVASHTVDAIDAILKSVRRRSQLPFGGVQVLFIGDLHQLPPVVKNHEWDFLKNYYPSIFFFDSIVLREHVPVMVELKEIFRQQDNTFIDVLNRISNNSLSQQNFELLNSRLKRNFVPPDDEGYITLTTHNNQADAINKKKLDTLKENSKIYYAIINRDFPENIFPAENELELKVGAQVMFLKNDVEGKQYYNGKIGTVIALNDNGIKVRCKGGHNDIDVKKYEWKNTNYSLNPDTREIVENELGSFEQYPLRLAWAITIHKSQGLTFDKLVIDAENAFANGQVYVALSRCTSLEGLVLTSSVNQSFLGAHHSLKEWQGKNQDDTKLAQKFEEARQKYALHELQNIFSFYRWYYELKDFREELDENREEFSEVCLEWLKAKAESQEKIQTVADKFKEQITSLSKENLNTEENEALQKRVKDAANYFSAEIQKWKEKFYAHPFSTDKKKVARYLDASLTEVAFILHEILHRVNHCKKGFTLNEYLKSGKKVETAADKIQSTYAQNQEKEVVVDGTTNEELYSRLAALRKQIASVTNAPLYMVFSSDAIQNVCKYLPQNKEELLKIKGFGKTKVGQYGDEVIQMVRDYCEEYNLQPKEIFPAKRERKLKEQKTPTVDETVNYFRTGKSIIDIAAERKLTVGTIEGHLAQAIKQGSIQIEDLIPMEQVKELAQHFPAVIEQEYAQLNAIKEKVSADVSFGKLKMVLAWIQRTNKN